MALFIFASLWCLFSFRRGLSISSLWGPAQNPIPGKEMRCKILLGNAPMVRQEREATAKQFQGAERKVFELGNGTVIYQDF